MDTTHGTTTTEASESEATTGSRAVVGPAALLRLEGVAAFLTATAAYYLLRGPL
jgi:hypothetical protein